jgi:hypothetical protein
MLAMQVVDMMGNSSVEWMDDLSEEQTEKL